MQQTLQTTQQRSVIFDGQVEAQIVLRISQSIFWGIVKTTGLRVDRGRKTSDEVESNFEGNVVNRNSVDTA